MFITDPEEMRAVAQHRWNKQYFTKSKKRSWMAIIVVWLVITMILLSINITVFVGLALFAIGYLIAWRWKRKTYDKAIDSMVEQYKREG